MKSVIDLFAGPGGWDVAAHAIGLDPLGIEWDNAACATREAAGLRTLQADVADLDPQRVLAEHVDAQSLDLLIASPPCQAFSMAGKGEGRKALGAYRDAIDEWAEGRPPSRDQLDEKCGDPRGHLVLEPLRWALALRPRFLACEQVEPVLPLWDALASALQRVGYYTWTGVLSAEQYGVPQTRKRAILLASLEGPVGRPAPTHQRYIPRRRQEEQAASLFDAGEPERIIAPEDRDLEPWVSMAEALGWGMTARPSVTLTGSDGKRWGVKPLGGGSGGQRALDHARDHGDWRLQMPVAFGADRSIAQPAPTMCVGKGPNDIKWVRAGANDHDADATPTHYFTRPSKDGGNQPRPIDAPAPTIASQGLARGRDVWVVEYRRGGDRLEESTSVDAPAPSVTSRADRWQIKPGTEADGREREATPRDPDWPAKRPATTVAGDPRIAQPGHKRDELNPDSPGTMEGAVRVTEAEAAVLQSFPPDYPWQGTKTKVFEQIGNAVPPLLALHALQTVLASADAERRAA